MSHQDAESVAATLRRAVLLSGMSRYELSRLADVSQSVLSRLVRGVGKLSLVNLERVADALGLEVVVRERASLVRGYCRSHSDENATLASFPGNEAPSVPVTVGEPKEREEALGRDPMV
jgi:transcriptional regulator with XRE-family HTH domain